MTSTKMRINILLLGLSITPMFMGAADFEAESFFESSASFSWANTSTVAGEVDWAFASGGPKFETKAGLIIPIVLADSDNFSLRIASQVGFDLNLDTDVSAAEKPYLLIDDTSAFARFGGGAVYLYKENSSTLTSYLGISGGLKLSGFEQADSSYLPVGADADDFWFRVFPLVRLDFENSVKVKNSFSAELNSFLEVNWDAERAYDRSWVPGLTVEADYRLMFQISKESGLTTELGLKGSTAWDSGILFDELKQEIEIRTVFDWKDLVRLRLIPAALHFEKQFGDSSISSDALSIGRVFSRIDFLSQIAREQWFFSLSIPWFSFDESMADLASENKWVLEIGIAIKS